MAEMIFIKPHRANLIQYLRRMETMYPWVIGFERRPAVFNATGNDTRINSAIGDRSSMNAVRSGFEAGNCDTAPRCIKYRRRRYASCLLRGQATTPINAAAGFHDHALATQSRIYHTRVCKKEHCVCNRYPHDGRRSGTNPSPKRDRR
jgi:hypothetical protein